MRVLFSTLLLTLALFSVASASDGNGPVLLLNIRIMRGSEMRMETQLGVLINSLGYASSGPTGQPHSPLGTYLLILPPGCDADPDGRSGDLSGWESLPLSITSAASSFECCGIRFYAYCPDADRIEVVVSDLPRPKLVGDQPDAGPSAASASTILGRLSAPME